MDEAARKIENLRGAIETIKAADLTTI